MPAQSSKVLLKEIVIIDQCTFHSASHKCFSVVLEVEGNAHVGGNIFR